MIRTLTPVTLLLALAVGGCESSPRPRQAAATSAPARPPAPTKLDEELLLRTAELLRDREFVRAPTFESSASFDAQRLSGCEGRCDEERRWLTRVLFGGKPPVFPAPVAHWDADRNVVSWDSTQSPEVACAGVLAELVRSLDDVDAAAATSWDGYLASAALRRGPGVFVAALDRARQRNDRIDASHLAMRPEALYDLEFTYNRFADGFATREGFAFVAAMIRSGGWSAVELAYNERPSYTLQIVRPDRYLAGDQPGQWTLPPELDAARTARGLRIALRGRVGPALFVEWLGQHLPAAAARVAYIGFEADHYRLFTGAEDQWEIDWVSLWRTPSVAEQVVAALEAGLKDRADGARFIVLRKGATVAVVGSSSEEADLAALGTALVSTLPVFQQPRPRGVRFQPTPIDRIQSRPQVSSIPRAVWTDAATGLTLDLGTLGDAWTLYPTTEPNLPWFAKHESGAVLQYLVEPQPLFDPPFGEQAYADLVRERFEATVVAERPPAVSRTDEPVAGTLIVDARGQIKDRTAEGELQLRAWHLANPPFVTTLSLQAPVDVFQALAAELTPLVASVQTPAAAAHTSGGVVEFSVEE